MAEKLSEHSSNEPKSMFGVFTFNFIEKPDEIWSGDLEKSRVEYCLPEEMSNNFFGVLFLLGKETMKFGELAVGELCPLSQELLSENVVGTLLKVKRGTYEIGIFRVLYIGKSPK